MSDFPDHDVDLVDTGPLLWWVLELLGATLLLDVCLAVSWTVPFTDPTTWVLIGAYTGFALRLAGRSLGGDRDGTRHALRRASLVVWAASAGAGLMTWML